MSLSLDKSLASTGTRFRLFPQARYLKSFSEPELVIVSLPPERIQPGPADTRMFVVNAKNKRSYHASGEAPQYKGAVVPGATPNAQGHYDHLDVNSQEFSCASMYATVRRVLDIWEDYFGHQIPWWFEDLFDRLELIPLIEDDNAWSGRGFLEFGFGRQPDGAIDRRAPHCQNFDVLAHEVGHSIIYGIVGTQRQGHASFEYNGFHESSGDMTAIVSVLHFDSVVDHLLQHSSGNLFSVNELSRLGELPDGREIRRVFNDKKLSDVSAHPELQHDLSLPLSGGLFDIFVEVFQKLLVDQQLISPQLAKRSSYTTSKSTHTKRCSIARTSKPDSQVAPCSRGSTTARVRSRSSPGTTQRPMAQAVAATSWRCSHAR